MRHARLRTLSSRTSARRRNSTRSQVPSGEIDSGSDRSIHTYQGRWGSWFHALARPTQSLPIRRTGVLTKYTAKFKIEVLSASAATAAQEGTAALISVVAQCVSPPQNESKGAAVTTLFGAVTQSYGEFMSVYDATDASLIADELLLQSLGNNDVTARIAIAGQLLDDGADPAAQYQDGDCANTLHVLLGRGLHDFEAEVPLLTRLLDGGADINKVIRKFGTPLETLAAQFKFSDETLAPFYDVLFARDDLDLLQTSVHDRSVYANVQKWVRRRAALVVRVDEYLRDR